MVVTGGPLLIREWMKQVEVLRSQYRVDCIWVSSGAIATARNAHQSLSSISKKRKLTLSEKQALSAIGQPTVFEQYSLALATLGRKTAQVLLTADDISHPTRRNNLRSTLDQLLKMGAVPVLNENDAVATDEIEFGDNDRLSALVGRLMHADRLVILTDVEGLLSGDPSSATSKRSPPTLIKEVTRVSPNVISLATGNTSSGLGKGGMASKLLAAREASKSGIATHLVKGDLRSVLLNLAEKDSAHWPGTVIGRTSSRRKKS